MPPVPFSCFPRPRHIQSPIIRINCSEYCTELYALRECSKSKRLHMRIWGTYTQILTGDTRYEHKRTNNNNKKYRSIENTCQIKWHLANKCIRYYVQCCPNAVDIAACMRCVQRVHYSILSAMQWQSIDQNRDYTMYMAIMWTWVIYTIAHISLIKQQQQQPQQRPRQTVYNFTWLFSICIVVRDWNKGGWAWIRSRTLERERERERKWPKRGVNEIEWLS